MRDYCIQALDVQCEKELEGVIRESERVKKMEGMVDVVGLGGEESHNESKDTVKVLKD